MKTKKWLKSKKVAIASVAGLVATIMTGSIGLSQVVITKYVSSNFRNTISSNGSETNANELNKSNSNIGKNIINSKPRGLSDTTTPNFTYENPYTNFEFSRLFAYQWTDESIVKNFVFQHLSELFTKVDNITLSNIIIVPNSIITNDATGEVSFLMYFNFWWLNGSGTNSNSPTFQLRFTGFKPVQAPFIQPGVGNKNSSFKFKEYKAAILPSDLLKTYVALNGTKLNDEALRKMSEYMWFGPLPTESPKFKFEFSGSANNLTGSLDLYIKVNGVFTELSSDNLFVKWTDFDTNPFIFHISSVKDGLSFSNKGITTISSTVVDVNSIPGIDIEYNAIDFVDYIKQPTSTLSRLIKTKIVSLIIPPEGRNYRDSDIVLKPETCESDYRSGNVKMKVVIKNFVTADSTIDKEFDFVFLNKPINIPQFSQANLYPALMNPTEALDKIKAEISDKSKTTFAQQQFIQLFVKMTGLPYTSTKVINVKQKSYDPTSLRITLSFQFSDIQQIDDLGNVISGPYWTENYTYQFYTDAKVTTIIDTITLTSSDMFDENTSATIVYPFQGKDNQEFIKSIIVNNGTVNKPGIVGPDNSINVDYSTKDIEITKMIENNREGYVVVEGKLKRYLEIDDAGKTELVTNSPKPFKTKIINFRRAISPTIISINNDYLNVFKDMLPSDFQSYYDAEQDKNKILNQLINIFDHPYTDSEGLIKNPSKFTNTSIHVLSTDNKTGTIKLQFTIDGKFVDDESLTFDPSQWTSDPIEFNFFKTLPTPTQILPEIFDETIPEYGYAGLVADIINGIKNINIETSDFEVLKQEVINSVLDAVTTKALKFLPQNFDIKTAYVKDSMIVEESDTSNANPSQWIEISFSLSHYIDENGQEIKPEMNKPKVFKTKIKSRGFRNVKNTRFIERSYKVPGVHNIKPSRWISENDVSNAVNFLWEEINSPRLKKVLQGDIPTNPDGSLGITKDDILVRLVRIEDGAARVYIEASLKKYWEFTNQGSGSNVVSTSQSGYPNWTPITLTGFDAPGVTVFPDEGQRFLVSSELAKYYASDLIKDDTVEGLTSDKFTTAKLRNFIALGDVDNNIQIFTNSIDGINWETVELSYENKNIHGISYLLIPNDKDGTLIVQGKLKQFWRIPEGSDTPQFLPPSSTDTGEFSIVLEGFKKRTPTFEGLNKGPIDITNDVASGTIASEVTNEEIINIFLRKSIKGEIPPNKPDSNSISEIVDKVTDNIAGTIRFRVKFNRIYDYDGLLNDSAISDNKIILTDYITFTTKNLVQPTRFINENEYKITERIFTRAYAQDAEEFLIPFIERDEKNPLVSKFQEMVFDNIITQGKLRLTPDDILFNKSNKPDISYSLEPNYLEGSLGVHITLFKYWNERGELVDIKPGEPGEILHKYVKFTNFRKSGITLVNERDSISIESTILSKFSPKKFVEKLQGGMNHDNITEYHITQTMIFANGVVATPNSYTDRMSETSIKIQSSDYQSPELQKDQVKVTFCFQNGYWNDIGKWVREDSKDYSIILSGFRTSQSTEFVGTEFNLIGKPYNQSQDKFGAEYNKDSPTQFKPNTDIQNKTVSQWQKELQNNGSSVEQQIRNFVKWNKDIILYNPAPTFGEEESDFTITNIQIDDAKGFITFDLQLNKYITDQGYVSGTEDGPKIQTGMKLYGFMSKGPTIEIGDNVLEAKDSLLEFINTYSSEQSKKGLLVTEVSMDENGDIYPVGLKVELQKFLRKYAIGGYAPLYDENPDFNITYENIVIKSITNINPFVGSIDVTFTLNRYYDDQGQLQNSQWKDVTKTITKFKTPENNNGPTILKDGIKPISQFPDDDGSMNTFFVDANGLGKVSADIFSTGSEEEKQLAITNLKKFIFYTYVEGNKDNLTWDDVEIMTGFNNYDNLTGEIRLAYRLKRYWSSSGPVDKPTSPFKDITITNFLTIRATEAINTTHNLVFPSQGYIIPSGYDDVINAIKTNEASKVVNNPEIAPRLKEYLLEYIAINRNKIFSNLPKNDPFYQNSGGLITTEEFKKMIRIDGILEDDSNGSLSLTISLKYYVDENGEIASPNLGVGESWKSFSNVKFVGFLVPKPTRIVYPEAFLDISINAPQQSNIFFEELVTLYPNSTKYVWNQSRPRDLVNDIKNNASGQWSEAISRKNVEDTIKSWIINNLLENGAAVTIDNVAISITDANNYFGFMQIKYEIRAGYIQLPDGSFVFDQNLNPPLRGNLKIIGFQKEEVELNSSRIVVYATIFGTLAALLILFILITIFVLKKKNDIEYRQ